jgi:dihydroceramidase
LFRPKLDFMSISLLILGIGSFLFHASMRQSLQFVDEIAMLGLAWSLLQGVLTDRKSSTYNGYIKISLAIIFPLFSAFYVWTGKIIYHATVFTLMLALIIVRGHYLFYWRTPSFPYAKTAVWKVQGRKTLCALLVAYVGWQVDLEYCAELRQLRERTGIPWAWLLELHGWWHVLTAYSAAGFMDIVREIQVELLKEGKE